MQFIHLEGKDLAVGLVATYRENVRKHLHCSQATGDWLAIMEIHHLSLHDLFPELAIVSQLDSPGCGWDVLPRMDHTTTNPNLIVEHVEPRLSADIIFLTQQLLVVCHAKTTQQRQKNGTKKRHKKRQKTNLQVLWIDHCIEAGHSHAIFGTFPQVGTNAHLTMA